MTRLVSSWSAGLAALLCIAAGVSAQEVRGTVRDASGAPVAGAVVELHAGDRAVARALAGERGQYRLTASGGGTYRVRVLRIGYRRVDGATLTVPDRGAITHDVVASSQAVRLADMVVRVDRRCLVRPAEGAQAAALWEEARTALFAAELAVDAGYWARTRQFEKELDRRSGRPSFERVWTEDRTVYGSPFSALPAPVLAESGYVRPSGDTVAYYAPDARVLVHDAFLDTHCFGVDESLVDQGLIGLRFEPVDELRQPDVEGTLWLDIETAELRWLDYVYTRLPGSVPREARGGRVDFRRLPGGEWIIQSWRIRMPVYTITLRQREPMPFGGPRQYQQRTVTAIRERGGEVVDIDARRPSPR
jgi:hypothetical protein